jgi:hypothetical protein
MIERRSPAMHTTSSDTVGRLAFGRSGVFATSARRDLEFDIREQLGGAESGLSPGAAQRISRLAAALAGMAHDLAASRRENRLLERENAALRREIERLQGQRDTDRTDASRS